MLVFDGFLTHDSVQSFTIEWAKDQIMATTYELIGHLMGSAECFNLVVKQW